MSYPTYEVLQVTKPADHVIHVQLNRPDKSNVMNGAFIRCVKPLIAASIIFEYHICCSNMSQSISKGLRV